jgi:hypothetical protein
MSLQQVIPQSIASGGPIEWDTLIRLRHMITGQYLAVRTEHPSDSASLQASSRPVDRQVAERLRRRRGLSSLPTNRSIDSRVDSPAEGRTPHGPGGIRVVVATLADALDADTLFRVGGTWVVMT